MNRVIFDKRVTIGFSKEQFDFLCDQVKDRKAESIAQQVRQFVNDKIDEAKQLKGEKER